MPNNGNHQLVTDIFSLQANGAAATQPAVQVVQDKGRIKSARSHPSQPAPLGTTLRPNQPNKTAPRAQKILTRKPNTVHLTLWVNPIVKEELPVHRSSGRPHGVQGWQLVPSASNPKHD
jgi:hypothetical protein